MTTEAKTSHSSVGIAFLFALIVLCFSLGLLGSLAQYPPRTTEGPNAHAVERHGEDAVLAWDVIRTRGGEERHCQHEDGTEYVIQYFQISPKTVALVIKTIDGYVKTSLFARAAYVFNRPNCSEPRRLEPQAIGAWAGLTAGLEKIVAEAETYRE